MQPLPFDSRRECEGARVLFRDGGWVLVYVAAHDRLVWLDLTKVIQM